VPRRRRFSKATAPDWQERLLWGRCTEDDLVRAYGSLDAAAERYERWRHSYGGNSGTRPAIFWCLYGPAELASASAFRDAVDLDDAVVRRRQLHEARRQWLRDNGHA
jgi:hypothetical protein